MPVLRLFLLATLTLGASTALVQQNAKEPHIGYLYPAGGRQGTVVTIVAGGQFLQGATQVHITGEGVKASVVQVLKPFRNFNREQTDLLKRRMEEIRDRRLAEMADGTSPGKKPAADRRGPNQRRRELTEKAPQEAAGQARKKEPGQAKSADVQLPDHPLLHDLDNKGLYELVHVGTSLLKSRRKRQPNRQLAEAVIVKVTIDADAVPGDRELRIETAQGLTNPVVFKVGTLPELTELEPNDREAFPPLPKQRWLPKRKPLKLPALVNGQIMPGDVDRFRFRAEKGQRLVIEAQARNLIPYLADAVPGWFQATLAIYDAAGNELVFSDDFRFHPDPVLFFRTPESGEYEVEIRDSIYRGREDFVYRLSISERPFVTRMFPLGGRVGDRTTAAIDGWNIRKSRLPLDTEEGQEDIRQSVYHRGRRFSNPIFYAVDSLPECKEKENNNNAAKAQLVELPTIINGRISKQGDVDVFQWAGRAGDKVVAEVYARRLHTPLDSLLYLTDASGNVVAWNDDHVIKEGHLHKDITGLVTHHADSYLLVELPADGTYFIRLCDAQRHGGGEYAYRLRLAAPEPDFALRVTPSSLSPSAGATVPITVHAIRKDGFDGPITVVLKDAGVSDAGVPDAGVPDAPAGFVLCGGTIPAGRESVRMTLTAPAEQLAQPISLQLEGSAAIGDLVVRHIAVPAEDMMQAFLYRHLVPAQELLVAVKKPKRRRPRLELTSHACIKIPAGGTAPLRVEAPHRPKLPDLQLELVAPPPGFTIERDSAVGQVPTWKLQLERETLPAGYQDNLIIEAFVMVKPRQKEGKPAGKTRRVSLGVLPAVPIEVVDR